jgi:aspartyl protease family protein
VWFLIAVGAALLLAFGLHTLFPEALRLEQSRMSLVYYAVWLGVIGSAILATFRQRWGQAARYGVAWVLILLALIAAYAYRTDLKEMAMRTGAAIVPGTAVEIAPGEIVLEASADGHFYVNAAVDGVSVRFLVDTGASGLALAAADARRLGFDPDALDYFLPVQTANGETLAARVTLREVRLGSIVFEGVPAAVMPPGALVTSLLGMAFLERFSGFEIAGDRLVLRR